MKRLINMATVIIVGVFMTVSPILAGSFAFAAEETDGKGSSCAQTAILNDINCDNGRGSSIVDIIGAVIDIMTVLIGILGAIGIAVTGIQYLTAGGSEEKTRKAKRRLFEIVIGLVAYVVMYALLKFLLPSFNPEQIP